ncbi:unnamed protein product [Rotaria magnacalcarata]
MSNTLQCHSSSIDDNECPLTDAEVSTLCQEFTSIANIDIDFAMNLLKGNQWNLERAVSAYFDSAICESLNSSNMPSSLSIANQYQNSNMNSESMTTGTKRFKLMSWNIDGLDEYAAEIRTRGVIDVIKKEEPDAVFLQEVVPPTVNFIQNSLPEYQFYAGNTQGYFVVILTRRDMFSVHGSEVVRYPGTNMNRNLLIVHARYKNSINIDLMTSHHESCAQPVSSHQRVEQLLLCFKRMKDAPLDRVVLFGGDLNMRENELQKAGHIPTGMCDLWIETGKPEECAYTWDMKMNTNKDFSSSVSPPRARFDRLYFRPSNRPDLKFQPINFELKGLEKISSVQRFCSDHWAIQASFEV